MIRIEIIHFPPTLCTKLDLPKVVGIQIAEGQYWPQPLEISKLYLLQVFTNLYSFFYTLSANLNLLLILNNSGSRPSFFQTYDI